MINSPYALPPPTPPW